MSEIKWIGLGILGLMVVACEPYPPQRGPYGPRPAPYYDDERYPPRDSAYAPPSRFETEDFNERPNYRPQRRPEPEVQAPPNREQYPVAQRTANPNQVLSPYSPYNVIDVEGFRSGQLAKDPSNGKIFRVP